jgi:hypothetical protein
MPYWTGLCVLRRTCIQDYETLFHVVILSKHHHHHNNAFVSVIILYTLQRTLYALFVLISCVCVYKIVVERIYNKV